MRLAAAVLAALVAVVLAGCAQTSTPGKSFQGAEKAVADQVAALKTAGERRKPADVCDKIVTSQLKSRIAAPGSDCASEMKKAIEDADGFDLSVTDVTITGNTATARVKSTTGDGKDVFRTFKFAKQGADWRISDFG